MNRVARWVVVVSLLSAPCWSETIMMPDNPDLQYTGRWDFSDPAAPFASWSGVSIETRFEGPLVAVTFDDAWGRNYWAAYVDHAEEPIVIKCEEGGKTYPIASDLSDGAHHLLLYKRTQGWNGSTQFKGLQLADEKTLLPPPARPKLKIEFYGDSITSGSGNLDVPARPDNDNSNPALVDHYMSYGPMTARAIGAEFHCISLGGIGLTKSYGVLNMPDVWDVIDQKERDNKWDFSKWQADIVVVNLFQNDSSQAFREGHADYTEMGGSPEGMVDAYVAFVRMLREKYPKAHIIGVLGSMSAVDKTRGPTWRGYVQKAIDTVREEDGDKRVHTCFFKYKETPAHPTVAEHQVMADTLSAYIKEHILNSEEESVSDSSVTEDN